MDEACIFGLEDVVFTAATFRTVRPGQRLCRFIYDGAKQRLHRFSEGGFSIAVRRDIAAMLTAPARGARRAPGDGVEGADEEGGYVGGGPALSDSESEQEAAASDSSSSSEEESSDEESEDEAGPFAIGDTVSVFVEPDADAPEGAESISLARLCEARAGGAWLVRWFFIPNRLPQRTRGFDVDLGREVCALPSPPPRFSKDVPWT